MKYCPKCFCLTTTTEHKYYGNKHNLVRSEIVCDKCHTTIEIKHYPVEKISWEK